MDGLTHTKATWLITGVAGFIGSHLLESLLKNDQQSEVYGKIKRTKDNLSGMKYPRSIIEISKHSSQGGLHPTQKPVALFEYLVKTYTNEGDVVLDNCMGSGTTAIACLNTGRNFIWFELDETYHTLANERIAKHLLERGD